MPANVPEAALRVHSVLLCLESDVLATAVQLAQAEHNKLRCDPGTQADAVQMTHQPAEQSQLLPIVLPDCTADEVALLACCLYCRHRLDQLLDSLPALLVLVLSSIAHRLACRDILCEVDRAMVRKCTGSSSSSSSSSSSTARRSTGWLTADNAVRAMLFAESKGLLGLQRTAVEFIWEHRGTVKINSKDAEDSLVMLLQHLRCKENA